MRSSAGGTSGSAGESGSGSSRMIAASVSAAEPRSKARRPLSISRSRQPKAKMSERVSASPPRACSGDM